MKIIDNKERTIKYEGEIPSVNMLYATLGNGRRILSKRGKAFKRDVYYRIMNSKIPKMSPDVPKGYELIIFYDWFNKTNLKPKKRDISNMLKIIEDACCEGLGFDDKDIFEFYVRKKDSLKKGFIIKFFYLNSYCRVNGCPE